jgi:high-affinity Fe2+/Pb2+ permease
VYGPLALLVVATALFAAGLVRWRVRRRDAPAGPDGVDLEQVQGFVFVGSGALVLLGLAVLVLGLVGRAGPAEAMGVLGLVAYLVYLLVALVLIRRTAARSARRALPWDQPPDVS